MRRDSAGNLRLGAAVVEMLLPQRRPLAMVDFVRHFSADPRPTLEAGRHISLNEPYLEGHFDGLPIWPGVLTIEGLGQASTILLVIHLLTRDAVRRGEDPEETLEALRNADRGARLHPGFRPEATEALGRSLASFRREFAMGAAVDVKFLEPVFPGCRLDYRVAWVADLGKMVRFDVEASCDGTTVVKGTLTGARLQGPVLPGM